MIRACWRLMRSSVVLCRSSRPMMRPAAGTRNTCTVGWAPVHTTKTPGTGACWAAGPSGITCPVYPPGTRYKEAMPRSVVSFDIGQTLVDLDLDFLALRLRQRGVSVAREALHAAAPAAWQHYDSLVESGASHPWHELMRMLLTGAGVDEPGLVDWLYEQQATANLWRKPIEPMIELVRELRARGVAIAALSNSEGHLRDLLEEIELAPLF